MADVTIYFEGYDSITQTYNSGGYNQDVAFTGLTGSAGSVTEATGISFSVTGAAATASVGSVTVELGQTVAVTGAVATASVGSETVTTDMVFSVTGSAATASGSARARRCEEGGSGSIYRRWQIYIPDHEPHFGGALA